MSKMKNIMTVRMGAAHYDVTIKDASGDADIRVDMAKMTREDRREFQRSVAEHYSKLMRLKPRSRRDRRRTERAA